MPNPPLADRVAQGTYARKQIFCRSRMVRWSHQSRFDLARALVAPGAGGRLLDYGCGDGTFLALVRDLYPYSTGADADPSLVTECATRFAGESGLVFAPTASLETVAAAFDMVVCMEVLEHCVEDERRRVLTELRRLVTPAGCVIISVPIETGPSLVGKQLMRALAGWRGLGDYRHRETYTPAELARMVFAGSRGGVARVAYTSGIAPGRTMTYYGHKGFNWRVLAEEADRHFHLDAPRFSPMPRLGSWLNSQVWFRCRPR